MVKTTLATALAIAAGVAQAAEMAGLTTEAPAMEAPAEAPEPISIELIPHEELGEAHFEPDAAVAPGQTLADFLGIKMPPMEEIAAKELGGERRRRNIEELALARNRPGVLDYPDYRRRPSGTIAVCVDIYYVGYVWPQDGLTIKCWDEDSDWDDFITEGITGWDGCMRKNWSDDGWYTYDYLSYADIYCEVSSPYFPVIEITSHVSYDRNPRSDYNAHINSFVDRIRHNVSPGVRPNGCGDQPWLAPILNVITNMVPVCNQHDMCYSNCDQTKQECEAEFEEYALSRCRKLHVDYGPNHGWCRDVIENVMSSILSGHLGDDAYRASQSNCPRGSRGYRG